MIEIVGGAPVGGVQRIRFPKDDRVRLIVRSDTDEVVEIPGYELTRRVQRRRSARFYFETSKEGLFEIDLTRGSDARSGSWRSASSVDPYVDLLDHDRLDRPLVRSGGDHLDRVHDVEALLDAAEQRVVGPAAT